MTQNDIFAALSGEAIEGALPETGGAFRTSGFVGPLAAGLKLWFWSPESLDDYAEQGRFTGYTKRGQQGSYHYHWPLEKGTEAAEAAELLDAYRPSMKWIVNMETARCLTLSADARDKWGSVISADASVYAPTYAKKRHEYHLVSLPSLVQSVALHAGFLGAPIVDFGPLLDADDGDFTDEFQWALGGNPEATERDFDALVGMGAEPGEDFQDYLDLLEALEDQDGRRVLLDWRYSYLGQARKRLWKALGESNFWAYIRPGAAATDKGRQYESTKGSRLAECLRFVDEPWKAPIMGHFYMLPDFRVDAVSKRGNRGSLPAIVRFFSDESEARAYAQDLTGESGDAAPAAVDVPEGVEVPAAWAEYPDEWPRYVKEFKDAHGGTWPAPPAVEQKAKELAVTAADLKTWWNVV